MILYLDTSAFVPLLIEEPTSQICGDLWDAADRVVTTRLTHIEAAAALAMAERLHRITGEQHDAGRERLDELWPQLDLVELDDHLMSAAAQAARSHSLRGYDAVHFAAALTVNDESLVAVAGDRALLDAWSVEDIAVIDTNTQPPDSGSTEGAPSPEDRH